jgi:hypothetical protein
LGARARVLAPANLRDEVMKELHTAVRYSQCSEAS